MTQGAKKKKLYVRVPGRCAFGAAAILACLTAAGSAAPGAPAIDSAPLLVQPAEGKASAGLLLPKRTRLIINYRRAMLA